MSWREHPDLLHRPLAPAKCCSQLQGQLRWVLTADTAAIQSLTGAITVYRKHNKPALGPVGDSLGDFDQWGPQ
jgi:hypothetical protein